MKAAITDICTHLMPLLGILSAIFMLEYTFQEYGDWHISEWLIGYALMSSYHDTGTDAEVILLESEKQNELHSHV